MPFTFILFTSSDFRLVTIQCTTPIIVFILFIKDDALNYFSDKELSTFSILMSLFFLFFFFIFGILFFTCDYLSIAMFAAMLFPFSFNTEHCFLSVFFFSLLLLFQVMLRHTTIVLCLVQQMILFNVTRP